MSFELFYKNYFSKYYIITCIKSKIPFSQMKWTVMWWTMESWMCYMIGNHVVEIPLYWESESRINNQCSQSFLRRIDSADHRSWNGTGKSAGCSFLRISFDARSGCIPCEEWQWVGARNIPILCGRMTTLVFQTGWQLNSGSEPGSL